MSDAAVLFVYKPSRFLHERYIPIKLPDDKDIRDNILDTIKYFKLNMFETLVLSRDMVTKETGLFKSSTPFSYVDVYEGLDVVGVDAYVWWSGVIDKCITYSNLAFCKDIEGLTILLSCKLIIEEKE
jgi:hypothetical protein